MRKANLSKYLPGLFICVSVISIFAAFALPPSVKPLASSVGAWTATGSLATGRQYHTATPLPGGQVLVAGGQDIYGNPLSDSEIYDPSTGVWTEAASLATGRFDHTATLLPSGKVLVAGGQDIHGNALSDCEIYDPSTGVWTETASLATGRFNHTATLLTSGQSARGRRD